MATVKFSVWPIMERHNFGGIASFVTAPFKAHSVETVEIKNVVDMREKFDDYCKRREAEGKPVEAHIYFPPNGGRKPPGFDANTRRGDQCGPRAILSELAPLK